MWAAAAVAGSAGSAPAMTLRITAASRTVRVMGPGVSWVWLIGTTPARDTRPTVGLNPTRPFTDEGHEIEPSVSVPMAAAAKLAATATPEPALEPHGERRGS